MEFVCLTCNKLIITVGLRRKDFCNDACKRKFYYDNMTPEQKELYCKKALIRAFRAKDKKRNKFKFLKDLTPIEIIKIKEIRGDLDNK